MNTSYLKKAVSLVTLSCLMTATVANSQDVNESFTGSEENGTTLQTIVRSVKKTSRNAANTDGSGAYTSNAVTVAGKLATRRIDTPHSVSVMTRQQLDDQQITTVDQALARTPGVTMISNDSSQSQFHIRGYAAESMVDGAPALGGLSGYQQLDMALYDRIEVLKGPAGVFMGQGNPSGVVNFVKKAPRDQFGASFLTSYGSWANKRFEADVTGPIDPEGRLRARGVLAGTDRDFYFKRAHDEKWVGAGMLEFDLTPQTLLALSASYQRDDAPSFSGLPAYSSSGAFIDVPRSTNPYPSWAFNDWRTQEYTAALSHDFYNDWTAKVSFTTRLQDQEFKDAYPTAGIGPSGDVNYARRWHDWSYQRQSIDAYVKGPVEFMGRTHELLLGANYASWQSEGLRRTYSSTTGNIFDPDASVAEPNGPGVTDDVREEQQRQWGVYGQASIEVTDPLKLILGGRVSWYDSRSRTTPVGNSSIDWTQGAETRGRFSPYAALVYELTENINAYASYSDIFSLQTQKKTGGGVLDPRVGSQYEVGLKGEFLDGRLQASGSLFYIEDQGRSYADDANPGFFLNAGKAESKGIELELSGEIMPGWQATAGYTFNRTEIVKAKSGAGDPLNFWLPEHSFKLWQQFRPQNSAYDGFFFGVGVVAYSKSSENTKKRVQDPYAVVDLQVGYDFDSNVRASLTVNNVFDTVYRTRIGGTNTYNTYGDPRNIQFAIRKTF
jgi:TonB-dependent siderophore receptor